MTKVPLGIVSAIRLRRANLGAGTAIVVLDCARVAGVGEWQPSAGVHLAGNHARNRFAAEWAGLIPQQNCPCAIHDIAHRARPAFEQCQHHRRSCGFDGARQTKLCLGHGEIIDVPRLLRRRRLGQRNDHDVCPPGGRHGRRDVGLLRQCRAGGIRHLFCPELCSQRREQRGHGRGIHRGVGALPGVRPAAVHCGERRRAGSSHEDPRVTREREQVAVVLQQCHCFVRSATADGAKRRRVGMGETSGIRPGLFEQPEVELQRQNAPHRFIDAQFADLAGMHERDHIVDERRGVRHHAHVDTGVDRHPYRVAPRARNVTHRLETNDVLPIRHDDAAESKLGTQQVSQQFATGVHGNPIDLAGVHHDRAHARVDRGTKRREKQLAKLALGNPRRRPVSPAQRHAVAEEMLSRRGHEDRTIALLHRKRWRWSHHRDGPGGEQRVDRRDGARLFCRDSDGAEHGCEVHILAERLEDARPERLPGDVEHRREIPGDATRSGFVRGNLVGSPYEHGIPRGRHREIVRKDGSATHVVVAVHGVDAVDHGDGHPPSCGKALHGGGQLDPLARRQRHACHVEERADAPLDDDLLQLGRVELLRSGGGSGDASDGGDVNLRHLADLFLERQLPEQRLHAGVGGLGARRPRNQHGHR